MCENEMFINTKFGDNFAEYDGQKYYLNTDNNFLNIYNLERKMFIELSLIN